MYIILDGSVEFTIDILNKKQFNDAYLVDICKDLGLNFNQLRQDIDRFLIDNMMTRKDL